MGFDVEGLIEYMLTTQTGPVKLTQHAILANYTEIDYEINIIILWHTVKIGLDSVS